MGRSGNPAPDALHLDHEPPLLPPSALLEEEDGTLRARLNRIASHSPLGERYEIKAEIGRGGMGRVLRVWDEVLQRELAMKVVSLEPGNETSVEQHATYKRQLFRFVEEARITGQLNHPGIVPVHEIALDEEGHLYFTMPLVEGEDLGKVFELVRRREQGWNLHRALSVLHKVCQTVAFAHSRGVIHRDLKPQNIMVGPFGEAYVVDWGLALILGKRERRALIGTPAYMSPEQAEGIQEQVGPRSDVYSLGAILYELLSERIPHQLSMEEEEAMARVIGKPPRPVSQLAADAPSELVAVCEKAMAADPDDRYQTVMQMADDLQAWMEGRVVHAYESGAWARVRKWGLRNRVLVRSLLAVLVVSAGVVVLQQQSTIRQVNAKRNEALRSGYAANINAADLGLRMYEMNEAKRRLLDCDVELRGWEWRHLLLRSDTSVAILRAHEAAVLAVAASPDGEWIASASDDGTVRLWSAATGRVERVLEGHGDVVTAVAFHPDSTLLASGSQDRTVRIWDLEHGTTVDTLDGHASRVTAVEFGPAGRLASGELDGRIIIWGATDDEPPIELETPGESVNSLAFDPATGRLASGHSAGVVRVWEVEHAIQLTQKQIGPDVVRALEFDPTGSLLAASVSRYVFLLDTHDLSVQESLAGHKGLITSVAFSPSGNELVSASFDNTVRLWTTAGRSLGSFIGHDDDVNGVAFLADGRRIVSASEDDTVRLWSTNARAVLSLEGHGGWVTCLAFRNDGERLISGSRDEQLIEWDVETGVPVTTIKADSGLDCVAYGPDDEIAFGCEDPSLRIGKARPDFDWRKLEGRGGYPRSVVFHPRGFVVVRDWQGVQVWDAATDEVQLAVDVLDDQNGSLAVDRPGTCFATGTENGEVRIRDLSTGAVLQVLRGKSSPITTLAFSSDGRLLACGAIDSSISLWSVSDQAWLGTLDGHESWITALAFAPDDSRLISGSLDNTVRIWNPHTLEALLALRGHEQAVTAVSFSPDGDQIASASKDGTVRIWRTAPAAESR
jgi:WD40 repeat protein